ncbi:MAG: carbohydrate ABC transporter permease [Acidimicrobiia bacterium]|nr:carbohydrate ABC transporter permease [Acidimicrobiia bacterium]MDH5420447.1 carbohydrate ABC transporter permease [Acidimicrobiia bacterium]MDH5503914.1 carbohydrate ABC transporter permease [Acidimicrobiia bacterium]
MSFSAGVRRQGIIRGRSWPIHVLLVLVTLAIGFPLVYAALISTQGNPDIFAFKLTPGDKLAQHFDDVWVGRNLGRSMWNSTVQSVLITVAKTILSLAAGLAFVYFRFRGKWLVFFFVLVTLMMPTEVMILALFRLVSSLGWQNTMTALVVPFAASATGAFLFRQHFSNLPSELAEAAQVDGASPIQFLTKILIPVSWNAIGALAVIQFVYGWNMYLWPVLIISDQKNQVIQVALQNLQGIDVGLTYGPLMLAALLASIPPAIIFILLQKQFMSGFSIGADK